MNAGKCATLSIIALKSAKSWVCNPASVFKIDDALIPTLSVVQTYKYLGLQISAQGADAHVEKSMKEKLAQLNRAPLKPQQRLWILKTKVIPSLHHQLVLADTSRGFLKFIDLTIRASVRRWTKLPKDTPISAYHATVKDGGLGIVT